MFQFSGFAHFFKCDYVAIAGLPHSEITGSILVCKSPVLIAAYHVLLRLQEPRHPPYALLYFLTYNLLNPFCIIRSTDLYLILNHVNEPL